MTPKKRILLVEDNLDDVFFMQRVSQQAEMACHIDVAPDGQAAIDYLSGKGEFSGKAKDPAPCLILLDLKLPYKNGFEVLKWIRTDSNCRTLPVLMFTTSREVSDVGEAYRLGANGYLVKPVNLGELVNILNSVRNFWLHYNVLPTVPHHEHSL